MSYSLTVTAAPSYCCAILKMILKLLIDAIWAKYHGSYRYLVVRWYQRCRHASWHLWILLNDNKICWYDIPLDLQEDAHFVRRASFYVKAQHKANYNTNDSWHEEDQRFFNALPALRKTFDNTHNCAIEGKLQYFNALLERFPSTYYEVFQAILPSLDNTSDRLVSMLSQLLERTLSLLALHGRPGCPNQDRLELSMVLARMIDSHRGWPHRYVPVAWVKAGLPLIQTLEGMHYIFELPICRYRGIDQYIQTFRGDKEIMLLIAEHCLPAYKLNEFEKADWSLRRDYKFMMKVVHRDASLFVSGHKSLHNKELMGLLAFANSADVIRAYVKKKGIRRGYGFFLRVFSLTKITLQTDSYFHIILWYQSQKCLPHMEPLLWKCIFEYLGITKMESHYFNDVARCARNNIVEYIDQTVLGINR